jgi:hypothetical protein
VRSIVCLIVLCILSNAIARWTHGPDAPKRRQPASLILRESRLLQLSGGADGTDVPIITVRVRTRDGIKRETLRADAQLVELQKTLQKKYKLPLARQRISPASGGQGAFSNEIDGPKSLTELGIEHGAMLSLELAPAAGGGSGHGETAPAAPPAASPAGDALGRGRGRRRRSQTMADFSAERSELEIVLETPGTSKCRFMSVEPGAGKAFADFILENEFEERRIALLFGRCVDATAAGETKRGLAIDVMYEPPQTCTADSMAVDQDAEAAAEIARAIHIAASLGLSFVGVAYAHPPRHHPMETSELALIVEQRAAAATAAGGGGGEAPAEQDGTASSSKKGGVGMSALGAGAPELFVGVRFRAVYEDEPIDGDVTAEAYEPTAQAEALVEKGVLIDAITTDAGSAAAGQAALSSASGLQFKIGPKNEPTADLSYFVSRVHDLSRAYTPPPFGALRTSFPVSSRGGAPLRKFHLRTFLARQREACLSFATSIVDFQLLLHVAPLLPPTLFTKLCAALPVCGGEAAAAGGSAGAGRKARDAATAIDEAEQWLCKYVGL